MSGAFSFEALTATHDRAAFCSGVPALDRYFREEPAIFALIANAKDEVALGFYDHLGFLRFASRPMTLFLPIAEAARRIAAIRC